MSKILVIAPHADDEVLGCGATMAKACAKKAHASQHLAVQLPMASKPAMMKVRKSQPVPTAISSTSAAAMPVPQTKNAR